MQGHIYKITNQVNGKVYVGQTVSKLAVRFNQHISYARRSKETGKRLIYLSKAILKYKPNNFIIELIETVRSVVTFACHSRLYDGLDV